MGAGDGGVCLVEGFEQPPHLLLGHAEAGVFDVDLQGELALARRLAAQADSDRTLGGELERVREKVVDDLAQARGVGRDKVRSLGRAGETQAHALLARLGPPEAQLVGDDFAQVVGDGLHRHPPGVELREVQKIVQQGAHHRPGVGDQTRIAPRGGAFQGAFQFSGAGQDGRDGCAELMADHGDEGGFGGDGAFGFGPALLGLGTRVELVIVRLVRRLPQPE